MMGRHDQRKRLPRHQWPIAGAAARRRTLLGAALIISVTSLAYLPSLRGGFILDDHVLLTHNPLAQAADGLYRIWLTAEPIDYWPVFNSTFWLEWRLWETNPIGYHVTNLALHIATALLIWAVLQRLLVPGAFLGAVLFAVHPVNVESVAWITQRKNLLALLFCLLSVLAYLRTETPIPRTRPRLRSDCWYYLSLVCFLLAMLSKASVAVFPLLLLGIICWLRPLTGRDLRPVVPFLLVSAVLVPVNAWFQGRFTNPDAAIGGLLERLLTAAAVVWFYLSKALLPVDLSFVYAGWQVHADRLRWWLPLLAAMVTTWTLWRYRQSWGGPLLFAWAYFCVALVPVMGFIGVGFMEHSPVADHYQHLALIGVTALVASGWAVWQQRAGGYWRWVLNAAAAAVVSTLAWLTWQQSRLYADDVTLFQATVEKNPDSPFVRNNLGLALLNAGRRQEASEQFERALQLRPDYPEASYNLGNVLAAGGRLDEAVESYQQAVRSRPGSPDYRYVLGGALVRARRLHEAIEQFEQALQLRPDHAETHNYLGGLMLETSRVEEAMQHYQGALRLAPDYAEPHYNLGRVLFQSGDVEGAIQHWQEALRLKADFPEAHNDLGVALAQTGRLPQAIEHFERAVTLRPDDHHSRVNLQEVLAMKQRAEDKDESSHAGRVGPLANGAPQSPPPPNSEIFRDPFAYCAAIGTIDAPNGRYAGPQVPEAIARGLQRAFGAAADEPLDPFLANSVWRCMKGEVYACSFGANLPCNAKADTSRSAAPAMVDYCRQLPDAEFIPAYATGRETVYVWRCRGAVPVIERAYTQPDERGYLSNIWYEIQHPAAPGIEGN